MLQSLNYSDPLQFDKEKLKKEKSFKVKKSKKSIKGRRLCSKSLSAKLLLVINVDCLILNLF